MREGRGKEEQKGNGDRGDEDSDRGWLRRRYRREAAAYSYNMFAQYSRSGPVGLLSSLRLPPISLSLSRLVGCIVQSGTAPCHIHSNVAGTRGSQ